MDLRHFRYFAMVASEGSFSRAAEALNMAQPPLSRQIQQLEEEIGARLRLTFYRDNGIEPKVAFEVRELQTALGLVAAAAGICLVPRPVRKVGRDEIVLFDLDQPKRTSPIIMSFRKHDTSKTLANLRSLVSEFDIWPAIAAE